METRGVYSRRRFVLICGAAPLALPPAAGLIQPVSARSTDTRIVNTAGAWLRSGASTGYPVIASLARGHRGSLPRPRRQRQRVRMAQGDAALQ